MSERGSFVTEYIYCNKCFAAAKRVLLQDDKYLRGVVVSGVTGTDDKELPIIAGKVGGLWLGQELYVFECELIPELSKEICHPLRIAVLSDSCGEQFFKATPK